MSQGEPSPTTQAQPASENPQVAGTAAAAPGAAGAPSPAPGAPAPGAPGKKEKLPLDARHVMLAALPFMGMISFWQVFDGLVPQILTGTFGLSNTVTGVVMALDNIFGLFLLPWFGILSDRCKSPWGRRTPFIVAGSLVAAVAIPLIAVAEQLHSLTLLIAMILITLLAICAYRTSTIAIVADITPRPLRTKADSYEKIVGYAGTGVMLVAIAVLVPSEGDINYLPVFGLQAAVILASAIIYKLTVNEPKLVDQMHAASRELGIAEDLIDNYAEDERDKGGNARIQNKELRNSILVMLAAVFFYYMSYNAMTTNISRYAASYFDLAGGSYAIINIATIAGGLISYVPVANASLHFGRKRIALMCAAVMCVVPAIVWLLPGFSPVYYVLFALLGAALGGVDLCLYPMILENISTDQVGRYSGYYYMVSMAGQVVTPILSGYVMDAAPTFLFGYICLMGVAMLVCIALTKYGNSLTLAQMRERQAAHHASGAA
jgi:Na+/melibiose symporter-like transporter